MKTIYCKVTDGKNITAVSNKTTLIQRIMEREDCSKKKAIELFENGETDWQEVFLD